MKRDTILRTTTWCMILITPIILLTSFTGNDDWDKEILKKIKTHQKYIRQEKLYLQTDRPIYTNGENIWLSGWLLNASDNSINKTEKVLYVELVSLDGHIADKITLKLHEGRTNGTIKIDENIEPGEYLLIGYTNWMRNFGNEYYYKTPITILSDNATNSVIKISEQESSTQATKTSIASETTNQLSVFFYPEGGEILAGTNNKIAYEVRKNNYESSAFSGVITDNTGKTVSTTSSMWAGLGYFNLIPEQGLTYKLTMTNNEGITHEFPLPHTQSEGYCLSIENAWNTSDIIATIKKINTKDTFVFLLATQDGTPVIAKKIELQSGEMNFSIPKESFKTGIVQLTLFDAHKKPRSERLIFINQSRNINLSINEKKLPNNARDKVEIELTASDTLGKPITGDFAISVTDAIRIPDEAYSKNNIVNYLNLSSNIPVILSNASIFFDNSRKAALKAELLMLTNGWRRYHWDEVLSDTLKLPKYYEEPGLYIKGNLSHNEKGRRAAEGVDITMLQSGKLNIYSQKTDKHGAFTFILNDFIDSANTVIQTRNKTNINSDYFIRYETNYQSKPIDNISNSKWIKTDTKEDSIKIPKGILESELIRALNNNFFVDTTDISLDEVTIKADRIKNIKANMAQQFGIPSYFVGNKQLNNFTESRPWQTGIISVISNAFPGLLIDLDDENSIIKFYLKEKIPHRFFIYIDGKIVGASNDHGELSYLQNLYSINELISMDPALIESIELTYPKEGKEKDNLNVISDFTVKSATEATESNISKTDETESKSTDITPTNESSNSTSTSSEAKQTFDANQALFDKNYTSPRAIISIYTKDGGGLRSQLHYKGIMNVKLQGFAKTQEFYHPIYDGRDNEKIVTDERNTLAWFPSVHTDSTGKANIMFYNSDIADEFRFEINGISAKGEPASLVHKTNKLTVNTLKNPKEEVSANVIEDTLSLIKRGTQIIGLPNNILTVAHVQVKGKQWGTFTNSNGEFYLDKNLLSDNDSIIISNIGYRPITKCIKDIQSLERIELETASIKTTETISGNEIMLKALNNYYKLKLDKELFLNAVYRERVNYQNELHRLKDFVIAQRIPARYDGPVSIATAIKSGRKYQSENYNMKIGIEPINKLNEIIPALDPFYLKLSFVNTAYRKNYTYNLEGIVDYLMRPMYLIVFDQTDNTKWPFYSGKILIDTETLGIAYIEWKYSNKKTDFIVPDNFLAPGIKESNFNLSNESNHAFYNLEDNKWLFKGSIQRVDFIFKQQPSSYIREMIVTDWSYKDEHFDDSKIKERNMLIKMPVYNINEWRNSSILPNEESINSQMKYLNEVSQYYK